MFRERINIEELFDFLGERPSNAKDLNEYWQNPIPGHQFVIKDQIKVRTVVGDSHDLGAPDDDYAVYYKSDDGDLVSVAIEDCNPLFNIAQMIEAINVFEEIQIQSVDKKWLVITNGKLYAGKTGEDLCSVLWRATKEFVIKEY